MAPIPCRPRPAILYSGLAVSLLAAFTPTLDKQHLDYYAQVGIHGPATNHSGHQQRKTNAMITWHFDHVMKCLPLIFQATLGYALSKYLSPTKSPPASSLFPLHSVSLSTSSSLSPLPFPTTVRSELRSLILRFLILFDDERKRYLKSKWLWRIFS